MLLRSLRNVLHHGKLRYATPTCSIFILVHVRRYRLLYAAYYLQTSLAFE